MDSIQNNVLYFIDFHRKSATKDKIIQCCTGHFPENQIIEARNELYEKCKDNLSKINQKLYIEVSKKRNTTERRDKSVVLTEDIIEIFKAFESKDKKLDIKAKDASNIPLGNLESACLLSVSSRINKVENENTELKKNIASLKADNCELTGRVITLEARLKFITEKLAINLPSPRVEGPDHLPQSPTPSGHEPTAPEIPNMGDF